MHKDSLTKLFYRLPQNIATIFWGKNLRWHGLAFVLTYISVTSGFDWWYFKSTQVIPRLLIWPAVIGGFFLPFLIPIILLLTGMVKKQKQIFITGCAIAQAAFIGWLTSAFYKSLTGRPGPASNITTDITHIFRFGFLRGGVFWGWPSSHTTVAVAMATCLVVLYPKNKKIKIVSILYAAYIAISVSMSIHWFSDAVAGTIFGILVGITIGKSFLKAPQSKD